MIKFRSAPAYYRLLNGILCVFKHDSDCVHKIIEKVQGNLCRDLNSLLCYSLDEEKHASKESVNKQFLPEVNSAGLASLQTVITESSSNSLLQSNSILETEKEFKLIFGERYIPSDIKMTFIDGLSRHSSGVLLLGIGNRGRHSAAMLAQSKCLRVYHVKGRLGFSTENFSPKGKFLEKASFRHVSQSKLDKICATAQAAHSREMYRYSGISPDSQDAYELAASGIIRPAERSTPPIIYGIKCIQYQPPDFTLEIHTINEHSLFLMKLIHDLAIQLKTRAVCSGIRRLRYGHFDVDRALVRSQWDLENIIDNIEVNESLLPSEVV